MHKWATDLFPICRSITGDGIRQTLSYIKELLPLIRIVEIPSGEKAFDWLVPDEWNINDAWIKGSNGQKLIDFKNNSGWIHTSQLSKIKSFILLEDKILFSKPTKYSKPIVKISSGRLLLVKKCKLKWCRVKTENYTGWVEVKNVWGSIN